MEVALRRRLEGVATISISQQQQTAEVVFAPGPHLFSPEEFRAAVGEAEVEVVSFEIEACGIFDPEGASGLPPEAERNTTAKGGALGASGAGASDALSASGLPREAERNSAAEVGARWFVAGPNRFLLSGALPRGGSRICISGALDDTHGVIHIRHFP